MSWYTRVGDAWELSIHVQPGAKQTAVAGLHGTSLKIRIQAPPVEGRANEALIGFLAGRLGVPKRDVRIVGGEHTRDKRVRVHASEAALSALL